MDDLRVSLLTIGAIAIVVIYLFGLRNAQRTRANCPAEKAQADGEAFFEIEVNTGHPHWPAANSSMSFEDPFDEYDEVIDFDELLYEINQTGLFNDRHYSYPEAFIAANDAVKTRPYISDRIATTPFPTQDEQPESLLIVINVMPRSGNRFDPLKLKACMESLGLQYGDMGIYHAYNGRDAEQARPAGRLFSVASVAEPGRFKQTDLASYQVPGLAFFLQLPGPMDGILAFESMQKTAQALAEKLGGVVCDASHSELTKQVSNTIKDRISAYDVKLHTVYQPQIH